MATTTMIIARQGTRISGYSCCMQRLGLRAIETRPTSFASFPTARPCFWSSPRPQVSSYPAIIRRFGTDNYSSSTENEILYEGPFATLTLRLKRVSISTALVSLVGIPAVMSVNAAASTVPVSGQFLVGGTALLAATGSTLAMSFCFSPYVHTLEKVVVRKCHYVKEHSSTDDPELKQDEETTIVEKKCLIKATTRNVFGMVVETVFDPSTDLSKPPSTSIRPFCNILAKGVPLYVHTELLHQEPLRSQFLQVLQDDDDWKEMQKSNKKDLEDDFF